MPKIYSFNSYIYNGYKNYVENFIYSIFLTSFAFSGLVLRKA